MPETNHISETSVAAAFVTMNRSATALTCLKRLASQTRPPSAVFVFDNASTADTEAAIRNFRGENPSLKIIYHRHPENLGNAGGMEMAIGKAHDAGFEHFWILDDDSWPEPDALEKLLSFYTAADAVRSCRVIDLSTGKLSWPVQIKTEGNWSLIEGADPLPDDSSSVEIRRSWLGALIPRSIYEAVGAVDGRLFLRGEDEDYPRRIEKKGFRTYMIKDSILHHPPSGPLNRWQLPGFTIVMERGLSGDKLYYRLRNAWWIMAKERGKPAAFVMSVFHFIALLRWERPVNEWLPEWKQACGDFLAGRLGKRQNPRPMA